MQRNTKRTFRVYWDHAKRYKVLMLGMLVTMVGSVGIELISPYFYKRFFDLLVEGGNSTTLAPQLIHILIIIAWLGVIWWIFERLKHFSVAYFEVNVMRNLASTCFNYLQQHSYRFFSDHFTGSLVKKVNRMVRAFENIIDRLYFDLFSLALQTITVFAVLTYLQPVIGIVMCVWTILFLIFNYWFTLYKWKYDIERAKMDTKTTAALADTITNNINIKLFASLPFELKRFKSVVQKWRDKTILEWNIGQIADAIQGASMILLEFLIFYLAIKAWEKGVLTIGDFVWIQSYLLVMFNNIWRFGRNIRNVYQSLADAEEMTVVLHQKT